MKNTILKTVFLTTIAILLFSCTKEEVKANLPTLTTATLANITPNSASLDVTISSDGGGPITARGIVWHTSQNPTVSLSTKTIDGTGIGTFTSQLINLIPGTTYYIRAYATNSAGTAYSIEISFTPDLMWTKINSSESYNLVKTNIAGKYFLNTKTTVLKSTDFGQNWTNTNWTLGIIRNISSSFWGSSFSTLNGGQLAVSTIDNGYLMSNDDGANYTQTGPTGFGCAAAKIITLNDGRFLASMGGFQRGIYKSSGTTNSTWSQKSNYGNNDPYDFCKTDNESVIFSVGYYSNGGIILKSTDGAETWSEVKTTSYVITNCEIINDYLYWTDNQGKIYRANYNSLNSNTIPELVKDFNTLNYDGNITYYKSRNIIIHTSNAVNISYDNGLTWKSYPLTSVTKYYNTVIADNAIFICTDKGVFKTLL
jgi:hypothetical protein